jgi:hypothetical protein
MPVEKSPPRRLVAEAAKVGEKRALDADVIGGLSQFFIDVEPGIPIRGGHVQSHAVQQPLLLSAIAGFPQVQRGKAGPGEKSVVLLLFSGQRSQKTFRESGEDGPGFP